MAKFRITWEEINYNEAIIDCPHIETKEQMEEAINEHQIVNVNADIPKMIRESDIIDVCFYLGNTYDGDCALEFAVEEVKP